MRENLLHEAQTDLIGRLSVPKGRQEGIQGLNAVVVRVERKVVSASREHKDLLLVQHVGTGWVQSLRIENPDVICAGFDLGDDRVMLLLTVNCVSYQSRDFRALRGAA